MKTNEKMKALLINEGAPANKKDDFYQGGQSQYEQSALRLFQEAGLPICEFKDFHAYGIHFTNAVLTPKKGRTYDKDTLEQAASTLERELREYPDLRAILLMGDVAKQVYTLINRREHKKRVIPAGSTYKLRTLVYYDGDIRIFPSYIMTGKNLDIEKSKRVMILEDIRELMRLLDIICN